MRYSNVFLMLAVGAVAVPAAFIGCSDGGGGSDNNSPSSSSATTGGGADCTPTNTVCKKVTTECIGLEDNSAATTFGLRMAQLTITSPKALASGLVGKTVAGGLTMNLPDCSLKGTGYFSWLLQFDKGAGKVETGGGKPAKDPTAGYCFVKETLGTADVASKVVDAPLTEGKFTADVGDITVPVYLDGDAKTYVLMLLHKVVITGTLSADNNCIGSFNSDTLDRKNGCQPEPPAKLAFTNDGTLDGYMTLEEADTVDVVGQSLCVLLAGDPMFSDGKSPAHCKRDADNKIVFKGDWCSTTNAAADGTCYDAAKLGAAYAASSVKINGNCGM